VVAWFIYINIVLKLNFSSQGILLLLFYEAVGDEKEVERFFSRSLHTFQTQSS
jgi:hypothetical protein